MKNMEGPSLPSSLFLSRINSIMNGKGGKSRKEWAMGLEEKIANRGMRLGRGDEHE
jgi:hypothetical protein